MNAEQKKLFRKAILRVLDEHGSQRFGLTASDIAALLPRFNFSTGKDEVDRELQYMAGDPLKYVEIVDAKGFSPEVRNWRLTTYGINFLATNE